ncbi:MAG: MipA/OmpV family protein [Woeseiaceae bacterium]
MHYFRFCSAILGILIAGNANAGSLLDYIRAYDLNDYALGLSVSASQSPYVGGENSLFGYPYLTSFRDSAFTDDWFLISEGNLGFRWVNDAGWELGLVGRMQTLGLGNSDADELRGLSDRNWSIEMAPMVGFRRWPVHLNLKTYWEVMGRHGGNISQFALSLPKEFERGYIVPSIEAYRRDADNAAYYFGVSAAEARPGRPEYEPGATTSFAAKVRWGYAITENWLLSGTVGIEYLGDEIKASPIVDKEETWSASLSLAYNSDLFQPRVANIGDKHQPKFEMRITAFADSADSKVVRDADDGTPGQEVDLEDLLGIPDSETIWMLDTFYRINAHHRIEVGYHEFSRTGNVTLGEDLRIGNSTFLAGTDLTSTFATELLRLAYGYSLMNDAQKELGVMAGVHVHSSVTDFVAQATGQHEHSDVSTPLPVVGLFGSVELGQHSTLAAKAQMFAMEFDRFEGILLYLNLEWQRRFGDHFSAGLAYNFYATDLESKDADANGTLQTRHHGPGIFFSASF